MQNPAIRNGFYMGLGCVALSLIFYFISPAVMISWGSWISYLVVVYFMYRTISEIREENGGFISLGDGFKNSWISFIIGMTLSSLFSFVLINYIDPSLLDIIREEQIKALEKMGDLFNMPEEDLQKQIAVIEETNPFNPATYILGLLVSFLFPGSLIAVIIAAIMKKNNPEHYRSV